MRQDFAGRESRGHTLWRVTHPELLVCVEVGRLLITLLLSERSILPLPLLHPSAYFEETHDDYTPICSR